jgi:hypothetical protein
VNQALFGFCKAVVDMFVGGFQVIVFYHMFRITKNVGRCQFVCIIFWFWCSKHICHAANFLVLVQQKVQLCCYFCLFESLGVYMVALWFMYWSLWHIFGRKFWYFICSPCHWLTLCGVLFLSST